MVSLVGCTMMPYLNKKSNTSSMLDVETHIVTFDSHGGTPVDSQIIKHGEKAIEPTTPEKLGYTFVGWTLQGEPWVFYKNTVTEDITLDANWQIIDYTVTFKNYDGTVLEVQNNIHYGDSVVYHGPTPRNTTDDHYIYTFSGWDTDTSFVVGNTTVVALFSREYVPYTVVYLDENDIVLYSSLVGEDESEDFVGTTPSKTDTTGQQLQYQFSGWEVVEKTQELVRYKASFECCTEGLIFENNSVYQYVGTAKNVYIPSKWNNQTISEISERAFEGTAVEKVVISEGMCSIKNSAFYMCSSLNSLELPSTITSIEYSAFCLCTSLQSFTVPNNITVISEQCFAGCSSLSTVIIHQDVTTIDMGAFSECTSLRNINLPSSISLIRDGAFANCTSLQSIILPTGIDKISYSCFSGCTSLTSVYMPNTVKEIDDYAFMHCSSLTSISIPNSVEKIDWMSFAQCTNLESVIIPKSVTTIVNGAFANCPNVTFYCESEYKPKDWEAGWNNERPVEWGYKTGN